MRSFGAVLGTNGLDFLALPPEMQRVEQIQIIFFGVGVKANDIR